MRSAGRNSASGRDDDHQARAQRVDALPDHKRALFEALRHRRHTAGTAGTGVEILRPGPGDPMVLVHPVGGDVLCYGELVALLPGNYPICGLAADGALRGDRPPSFTSLVTHYVDRLDRAGVQPMLLAGWSFGGMMAYEMARHLAGRRHPVEVVVIDAIPPLGTVPRKLSPPELMAAFAVDLVRSAALRPTEINFDPAMWRMPERAALAVLRTEMAAHGIELGLSPDELADRARVYVNGFAALDRHRPAPDGPAVRVLWATGSATDARVCWRDVAGQVHGIGVPADHYSLLRRPAVIAVAEFLHGAVTATGIPR